MTLFDQNERDQTVTDEAQIKQLGSRAVLCAASDAAIVTETLFDPEALAAGQLLDGLARGRGEAYFIRLGGQHLVLRHYRRGGLVGRFFRDGYLFRSLEASRSWREWRLLAELRRRGLPVPRPVAAAVQRAGLYYQADLVTELIPETQTLAELLKETRLTPDGWQALGKCLRDFHRAGVFHADLNASNILIGPGQQIFLIDFDRGAVRATGRWQQRTLRRLKRSLRKFHQREKTFHFSELDWDRLREGYAQP